MPDPIRLRQRLRESLKVAMRAGDSTAIAAFRSAVSAIDNAEAVDLSNAPGPTGGAIEDALLGVGAGEVARRELSAKDVVEIVRAEVREHAAAAAEYERLGRPEQASRFNAQATALESFLETAVKER
jgi:uncharacterized protein